MNELRARCGLAPGNGLVVRRATAVLLVTDPDGDAAEALIGRFRATSGPVADVVGELVVADNRTPAFALVEWPPAGSDERIIVMARGDVVVTSDLASMPSLTGSAAPTWVEHRVPGHPSAARFHVGPAANPGSDLVDGIAPAGGFELSLSSSVAQRHDDAEDDPERTFGPEEFDELAAAPGEAIDPSESAAGPPTAPSTGADALAAVGADWMEESLDLRSPPAGDAAEAPPASFTPTPTAAPAATPESEPTPAADSAPVADRPPAAPDDETRGTQRPPPPRPRFDDDAAPAPPNPADHTATAASPIVEAVHCAAGHPTAPGDTTCRRCGRPIDPGTDVVTVERPVVAILVLPDGRRHPLDSATIVGRRPDHAAAGVSSDAVLLAVDGGDTTSRTHCLVAVHGWNVTVTDCGSTSGTALLADGATDPIVLVPWVAHEFDVGDTVFLGGPTPLRLADVELDPEPDRDHDPTPGSDDPARGES